MASAWLRWLSDVVPAALAWRRYGGRALEGGLAGVVEVPRHELRLRAEIQARMPRRE